MTPVKGHRSPEAHHGKGLTVQAMSPGNPQQRDGDHQDNDKGFGDTFKVHDQ